MTAAEMLKEVSKTAVRARLAVVCDFVEEEWPSMDLVGEMIARHMELNHGDEFNVSHICPPLHRRLTRIPVFSRAPWAFNVERLLNRFSD